ncbi:MAG: hypothetical protein P0111_10590 [Nitrospira sp.]|nr:hypothetical protein [Nitrospira sp.]
MSLRDRLYDYRRMIVSGNETKVLLIVLFDAIKTGLDLGIAPVRSDEVNGGLK